MSSFSEELESPSPRSIRAILRSGDLDRIESLFDATWYDLPHHFAPEVLQAVDTLPSSTFDARPRLVHLALLAHHRVSHAHSDHRRLRRALQYYVIAGQRYGKQLTSLDRPADLVTAGATAVISARRRGDFNRSELLGAWADSQVALGTVRPALPWLGGQAASRPGWLSAERGLTATLAGSLDRATQLFTRAHAEAGDPPYAHFAGTSAAAHLALLAAYRGHLDLARTWLTTFESSGPLPDWVAQLTTAGAEIARALIAIDEGDTANATMLLNRIGPATQDMELWPFVAFANACNEAHFGDPQKGLRMLDTARQQHGALQPVPTTMVGELVLRAEAKLLLRVGARTRVLNLADRHPEVGSLMLYAAWAHLLAGEHHEAMRLSSQALENHDLPVNDLMSHHLVQATAALRTRHPDDAAASFLTAVRMRSTAAHVSPFLALEDDELEELSALAHVPNPLQGNGSTARRNTPPAGPVVHLTPREREVLRALSAGMTAERAAVQFSVSVTTVRTQIRKIYQKLEVSHRGEALAKAQRLGLLRPPRPVAHDRAG